MTCARANSLVWRGRGHLVAQADLLTPLKAHASLAAYPANINFNKNFMTNSPMLTKCIQA
jgi:hypothetical protein